MFRSETPASNQQLIIFEIVAPDNVGRIETLSQSINNVSHFVDMISSMLAALIECIIELGLL